MRLLLVEDNEALSGMIVAHLTARGCEVAWASSGEAALLTAARGFDAAVLDLGLPDIDGLDLLRGWRAAACTMPVLILTARDRVEQRIAGLDAGADDYILKPFDVNELEARLRAVLRRHGPAGETGNEIGFGDLLFDRARRTARCRGTALDLTRREGALLDELMRNGERIVVRDVLTERLYGMDDDVSGNAIEATVSRLRRKLLGAGSLVRIEAMRGVGYRLRQGGS